jgi:hypothetical protein
MISKEKIEAKLAALPAKSGHARILRRKLEKRFPEVSAPPVVEEVVEPVVEEVEEQLKKRVTRKKKKD